MLGLQIQAMPKIFGFFILAMALQAHSWARMYVYVSVSGEQRIVVFQLDESKGSLTPKGSLDVDGSPGSIWPHPTRPEFFVALRSTGKLATLDVDRSTGMLSVGARDDSWGIFAFCLAGPLRAIFAVGLLQRGEGEGAFDCGRWRTFD